MKTLKFTTLLAEMILSGEKTTTWRLFDDKDLSEGDELEFVNKENGEVFAHAVAGRVYMKPLGQVNEDDYSGHERYASHDAMLAKFRKFYGDAVDDSTELKIVRFTVNPV